MERVAIEQAKRKLDAARKAMANLGSCKSFHEFLDEWSTILNACNNVFTKLEKGARMNAKSRQWMGGKKQFRKTDELLAYLHQARNADEHGLLDVAKHHEGAIGFGIRPGYGSLHIKSLTMVNGQITVDTDQPEALQVNVTPPSTQLERVYDDRSDRWYPVPSAHNGQPIADKSPDVIARLAIDYCAALIIECEALPWLK
jgi:hypothetical protein